MEKKLGITSDEYKSLYQNYEKQISGSDASRQQVKKLKYDLLNALIEQKLLFNLISELGLTVGEESIKKTIFKMIKANLTKINSMKR